jgi:hypothetical protein
MYTVLCNPKIQKKAQRKEKKAKKIHPNQKHHRYKSTLQSTKVVKKRKFLSIPKP